MKKLCCVFVIGFCLVSFPGLAELVRVSPNRQAIAEVEAGNHRVAKASWWGFDPHDATDSLQAAIDSGVERLVIEDMGVPWIVRPLFLVSNQEIVLAEGTELLAKRGEFTARNDALVTLRSIENVTISGYGATMRMHRDDYAAAPYEKAEWRHAINILSSSDISILGLKLTESGGDGIYLGEDSNHRQTNRRVLIRDVVCDRNYRQGISVITVDGLLIENTILSNTSGTAPSAGIDFEPNHSNQKLRNIVMRDSVTRNNSGSGYEFHLTNLRKTSEPVSIRIENCISERDRTSVRITTANPPGRAVRGIIEFSGCRFSEGRAAGILFRNKPVEGIPVRFMDSALIDSGGGESLAPIVFQVREDAVRKVGGVHFENFTVREQDERNPMMRSSETFEGVEVGGLTGSLWLEREGVRKELLLTEDLVASWMTVVPVPDLPVVPLDDLKLIPASPAIERLEVTRQKGFPGLNLRGEVALALYAAAGENPRMEFGHFQVGRLTGSNLPIRVVTPSGQEFVAAEIPFGEVEEISWTASENGVFRIYADTRGNRLRLRSSSHPVNLNTEDGPLNIFRTTGELYFWVPSGTSEFGVMVEGQGTGEAVKIRLLNPNGELIDERDNVTSPQLLEVKVEPTVAAAPWKIELLRPSDIYFEDFSIGLLGVPPLFGPGPEMLLIPQ